MWRAGLTAIFLLAIVGGEAKATGPYAVFFDPAGTNLSPQATSILDNFASSWRAIQHADVEILGHADRVGSVDFNRRLSCTRVALVRDYLVGRGVPAERIRISGWGELFPIVETPDEVAEPQNRRVEIIFMDPGRSAEPDEKLFPTDPLPRKAVGCLSMGGARARARP